MITLSTPREDCVARAIKAMQEQLGEAKGPTHEFYREMAEKYDVTEEELHLGWIRTNFPEWWKD